MLYFACRTLLQETHLICKKYPTDTQIVTWSTCIYNNVLSMLFSRLTKPSNIVFGTFDNGYTSYIALGSCR